MRDTGRHSVERNIQLFLGSKAVMLVYLIFFTQGQRNHTGLKIPINAIMIFNHRTQFYSRSQSTLILNIYVVNRKSTHPSSNTIAPLLAVGLAPFYCILACRIQQRIRMPIRLTSQTSWWYNLCCKAPQRKKLTILRSEVPERVSAQELPLGLG